MQVGFSHVISMPDVDFAAPIQIKRDASQSSLSVRGWNYQNRQYLSEGGEHALSDALCTESQEDIYSELFAPRAELSPFQAAVQRAHAELIKVLGEGQAAAKATERETLLNAIAPNARIIRNKRESIVRIGNCVKYLAPKALGLFMLAESSGAFALKIGSIPRHGETSDFRGLDLDFTTVPFQNLPFAFCVSWLGGELMKKAHDWLQPSYMSNLDGSLKAVSLLAEDVRRVGLDASNARLGGDAAARLRQTLGEHGLDFFESLMNTVDKSAYDFLWALLQPGPAVPVEQFFVETGVSAAAVQFSAARTEATRFIHTFFGREAGGRAVVREWTPSARFSDLGSSKMVAFDPIGKSEARLNRIRSDFPAPTSSVKVWDYSRSLDEGIRYVDSKARELYALDSSPSAVAAWKRLSADLKLSKAYDVDAMYRVAQALEGDQLGIVAGTERASLTKQLYLPAALMGDKNAQYRLGVLHATEHGFGWQGKKNDQQACDWLTKAANQDHPDALGLLGVMHDQGRTGLPFKIAQREAYECCHRAIEAGVSNADLFATYAKLCKMRSQTDVSTIFYQKAASLEHPSALLETGLVHLKHQRFEEAASSFRSAKAQGNKRAAYCLGELYFSQKIAPPDRMSLPEAAAMCFQEAALFGDIDAHFKMGLLLLQKGWGNHPSGQPDFVRAAYHFECASKARHAQAKYHLACLYADLRVLPKEGEKLDQKVFQLLNDAELLGCGLARLPLVSWLSSHAVLEKSESNQRIVELLKSLFKTAENPEPMLAYKLGMMYLNEEDGLPSGDKGQAQAKKWLKVAADRGLSEALDALKTLSLKNQAGASDVG